MSSSQGKKKALIVAISQYDFSDYYEPLDFCEKDGNQMYDTLSNLGYEIPEKWKIIGRVSKLEFEKAVTDFFRGDHIDPDDTLLFYYSGHGTPSGKNDYYFVTSDTNLKPDIEGFDYDVLSKISNNSKSKKIVKIIDCCYSGALGKSNENAQALIGKNLIKNKFTEEGQGNYVIASSLGTQASYSNDDHSMSEFTFHITNGLNGVNADSVEKDGHVTPHSLGNYAAKKMRHLEKNQLPINNTQATGDIFLAHYPNLAIAQPVLISEQYSDEQRRIMKRKTNVTIIAAAIISAIVILGFSLTYETDNLQSYSFVTQWGPDSSGYSQMASKNIDIDSSGNMYMINDFDTVAKFTKEGKFVTKWGSEGSGDGQFHNLEDITVDSSDNVYVVDSDNQRIQKFTNEGEFVTKWGSEGSGDGQFGSPSGITVDSSDNVYVVDSDNQRIQKFTLAEPCPLNTKEIKSGICFVTKWGSEGSGDGQFSRPSGITVDSSDNVYVVDSDNHRIQKFTNEGEFIRMWGSEGSGDGQFYFTPADIVIDSLDTIYVTDNSRSIQKFTNEGEFIRMWGSESGEDEQFVSNWPFHIAIDSSDNVYIPNLLDHSIQKFTNEGEFIRMWGGISTGDGQFFRPFGITVDSSDNVYVVDSDNQRIQKFTLAEPCPLNTKEIKSGICFVTKWGSFGSGDGQFSAPSGITVDSSDNVYVVDSNNERIQKFTNEGEFIRMWGSEGSGDGQFSRPSGITVDSSDNVYVVDSDNHRIQKFTNEGEFIRMWGSEGSGDGQFGSYYSYLGPNGISVDSLDDIYVADTSNQRIQKFTNEGEFIRMWGSYGSEDGLFGGLGDITVDSLDNVYVVDNYNQRIQKFTNEGEFITKWGSEGSGEGRFGTPWAIDVDSSNKVYITDVDRNIIHLFAPT